jgi:hypothetical protein
MGRSREIRGGRFEPNMGVAEVAVKSTDVERGPLGSDLISKWLQNTVLELHPKKGYSAVGHRTGSVLSKTKSGRKRAPTGRIRRSKDDELRGEHGDGGPDEAAAFIAETAAELVRLARGHRLDMLGHLLRMAELEAEEYLRLRGKRKLS